MKIVEGFRILFSSLILDKHENDEQLYASTAGSFSATKLEKDFEDGNLGVGVRTAQTTMKEKLQVKGVQMDSKTENKDSTKEKNAPKERGE